MEIKWNHVKYTLELQETLTTQTRITLQTITAKRWFGQTSAVRVCGLTGNKFAVNSNLTLAKIHPPQSADFSRLNRWQMGSDKSGNRTHKPRAPGAGRPVKKRTLSVGQKILYHFNGTMGEMLTVTEVTRTKFVMIDESGNKHIFGY
jgi:hypothetical protein